MTRNNMTHPCPSNEELWSLYERQAEQVEQTWMEFQRCSDEAAEADARRDAAWNAWTEACRVHGELFDNAFKATYGRTVAA